MKTKTLFRVLSLLLIASFSFQTQTMAIGKPIRLAVAGMTHGHISFIMGRPDKGDFKLVGFYEPNQELTKQL